MSTSPSLPLLRVGAAAAALLTTLACGKAGRPAGLMDGDDPWAKRQWIDKAGRALLWGHVLAGDEIEALAAKPREEIVQTLLADPRFADTVLDFNLYFLGSKPAQLYTSSAPDSRTYDEAVGEKPQALAAARALVAGQDYFTLFDYAQPFFLLPFNKPIPYDPDANQPLPLPAAQLRAKFLGQALANHDAIMAQFVVGPGADATKVAKDACAALDASTGDLFVRLIFAGLTKAQTSDVFFAMYLPTFIECSQSPDATTTAKVQTLLGTARTLLTTLIAHAEQYAPETYKTRQVQDIIEANPADVGMPDVEKTAYTTGGFWTSLPNSSTNFNRKRAAYLLRTYFCDDLTPINIAQPDAHAGSQHASDPGCQACHYKLDPMAGFFRYRGYGGRNYEASKYLQFDDRATLSGDRLTAYYGSWKAPAGAGRDWNVGYVRTPNADQTSRNSYGATLADLAGILRTAPEVKQCLTKRLASYFLGEGQTYDGGWLASLAKQLDVPAAQSAAGFKTVVASLVQSHAFTEPDPAPDQCYDFPPAAPVSRVPCTVSFVLNNNCASCHNASGASGGLDLSGWVTLADGTETFPFLDEHGQQRTRAVSLALILDRISTNDPDKQMPKNKYMSAGDRATLYKWLSL